MTWPLPKGREFPIGKSSCVWLSWLLWLPLFAQIFKWQDLSTLYTSKERERERERVYVCVCVSQVSFFRLFHYYWKNSHQFFPDLGVLFCFDLACGMQKFPGQGFNLCHCSTWAKAVTKWSHHGTPLNLVLVVKSYPCSVGDTVYFFRGEIVKRYLFNNRSPLQEVPSVHMCQAQPFMLSVISSEPFEKAITSISHFK